MYQNDEPNELVSQAPETADGSTDAGEEAETMGISAEATADAETTAIAEGETASAASGRGELTASFLAEIARAMRAAAVQERERIAGAIAESTAAHEQKVRDRGSTEATELRRLADEDVSSIETTAAAEIQRIKEDSERRVAERRGELAEYLERHAALIETEIGRVRGAVDDYGAELDGFFGRLDEEQSPAEIARLAGQLPQPPDMDHVGAVARAEAVAAIADEAAQAEAAQAAEAARAVEAAEGEGMPVGEASPEGAAEPEVVAVMDPDVGEPVMSDAPAEAEPEAVPAGSAGEEAPAEGESDTVAPSSSGMSAAKLLRNLAPWTSPDRPTDDHQS
jgi:hypothetical protein